MSQVPVIKEVDGVKVTNPHRAFCHCGRVVLELDLPNGIEEPRRCDCSICRRKGAVVATVPLSRLKIVSGREVLREYQFNTNVARHFFCAVCGIYTHHQRRSNPNEYAFNVGCLEGINPLKIIDVQVNDGINHPDDASHAT